MLFRLEMSQYRERFGRQRKKEEEEELLVFGYGCKQFQDDERAVEQSEGKNLIAWMGDPQIMCDRYDCRLHLQNLTEWEATGHSSDYYLTAEEADVEAQCDQERYADLGKDNAEEQIYKEEEAKRMQAELGDRGAMIHFQYDNNTQPDKPTEVKQEEPTTSDVAEAPGDSFVPRSELKLPAGVEYPQSRKMNTIIEKTASFVASNGVQMEIVIKAKQSRNPQFKFLDWDNPLNRYYKHLLKMIKEKKYVPIDEDIKKPHDSDSDSDSDGGDYLHPSLMAGANKGSGTPTLGSRSPNVGSPKPPEIKYKLGQENDVYSQLYNNLSKMIVKAEVKKEDDLYEQQCQLAQTAWENYNYQQMSQTAFIPPANWQQVIDRMAEYVARNGPEFELMVRQRGDPMFSFIDQSSPFFPYYQHKISQHVYEDLCKKKAAAQKAKPPVETPAPSSSGSVSESGPTAIKSSVKPKVSQVADMELKPLRKVTPISFSLKPKEVPGANTPLSAVFTRAILDEEDSDDVEYQDDSQTHSRDEQDSDETRDESSLEAPPSQLEKIFAVDNSAADEAFLQEESRQLQVLMEQAKEKLMEIQRLKELEESHQNPDLQSDQMSAVLEDSTDSTDAATSHNEMVTDSTVNCEPLQPITETTADNNDLSNDDNKSAPPVDDANDQSKTDANVSLDVESLVENVPNCSSSISVAGDSEALRIQRKLKAQMFIRGLQSANTSQSPTARNVPSNIANNATGSVVVLNAKSPPVAVKNGDMKSRPKSSSSSSDEDKSDSRRKGARKRQGSSSSETERDLKRTKRRRSRDLPSSYARSHRHARERRREKEDRRRRSTSRDRHHSSSRHRRSRSRRRR